MLKLKVCGLKYPENILHLVEFQPDYIGFIFYPQSPRYCKGYLTKELLHAIPPEILKTGVFVNENIQPIFEITTNYSLNLVQLHGTETAEFCETIKSSGTRVIKAFHIHKEFDFAELNPFKPFCDFFLFDTKTTEYGGSGKSFDWNILKKYDNEIPFFLSGGIDSDDLDKIMNLCDLNLHAIDINSKFETLPGLKDVYKVAGFIQTIRNRKMENHASKA